MTCNNQGNPKWIFVLYLAIQRRLYTRDRLKNGGSQVNNNILHLAREELQDLSKQGEEHGVDN
ncbi:hypothetical protein H5410_011228 [Solanum commersonii]|uniref:Uncharacterized protein n=1 Tax=Solanum commersonii TaxID=4109 RepID=A0A9J6APC3_SOLCO|nr:hypothetical protein H5410_011228 [Solanum commersonii]